MIVMAATVWPLAAWAQDWTRLDDAGIRAALAGRVLAYDAHTRQAFHPDGATRYYTERVADGLWDVRDGQFCSQWPPSDGWECYTVDISGQDVRFVGASGHVSTGRFLE
jgi:hypothetical protein